MVRYQSLAGETEKLITDGVLRAGDRLPSVRPSPVFSVLPNQNFAYLNFLR